MGCYRIYFGKNIRNPPLQWTDNIVFGSIEITISLSGDGCRKRRIVEIGKICYNPDTESQRAKGGLPSIFGGANPPDERKEGDADGYIC